jgi:hypothetical protein
MNCAKCEAYTAAHEKGICVCDCHGPDQYGLRDTHSPHWPDRRERMVIGLVSAILGARTHWEHCDSVGKDPAHEACTRAMEITTRIMKYLGDNP